MRNYNPDNANRFDHCINDIFLKRWHDHNNLVLDVDNNTKTSLEDILLSLDDIKQAGESCFGRFDNIDIRIH